ncbi:class I SAM-dependent methyltransferase [Kitasatospora sp. NPDC056800]|uniref:class I SAM-dependent methyltransferase n=1 Tax=Kitasatospora sp. NPDC056800 TaxID=3345948 RepID=UPI0036BF59A1
MNPQHDQDLGWDASGALREREAGVHAPALLRAVEWLRGLLRIGGGGHAPVHRVLDVGSGPGVVTCLLARTFPDAEVVAVDRSPGLLEQVRSRAAAQGVADRVVTQLTDVSGEFDALGAADLIWSRHGVQQVGDQQAALRSLVACLRPGGLLAVAESGLPPRFLPRDIGTGRPGLQARLDAAAEDAFGAMRDQLPGAAATVEDWPAMLARAGLVPSGTRSFFTDLTSPLGMSAREYLHLRLTRLRDRIGDRLDPEDRATLEQLLDSDTSAGILGRPDAFYLTADTVHTARLCHGGVRH